MAGPDHQGGPPVNRAGHIRVGQATGPHGVQDRDGWPTDHGGDSWLFWTEPGDLDWDS